MDFNKNKKIVLKIFIWIIGSILCLVLLVFILVELPAVQNYARKKAVTFLETKLHTKVKIDKLHIYLPNDIELKGVYLEDQKRDTLFAGKNLEINISLLKLLNKQVQINQIDFQGLTINIQRTLPDSSFNFDYILKAFSSAPNPSGKSEGMAISLNNIKLHDIRLTYKDAVTASDISVRFDLFETSFKEFDLKKMKFSIPDISLSDLNATIFQSKPALKQESTAKVEADSNKPGAFILSLGTIDFSKIKIHYRNDISNLNANIDLGQLLVNVESINLKKQRIYLKDITLDNSKVQVVLKRSEQAKIMVKEIGKVAVATLNNDWRVFLKAADFSDIDLNYDDYNKPSLKKGMDFSHLGITGFNLKAKDFSYSMDTISGKIIDASLKNKEEFVLNGFATNFIYCNKGLTLKNLYLETPGTILRDYIQIGYPSLETLAKNPGALSINANLVNSKLSFKDVLELMPQMAEMDPFKKNPYAIVYISGKVNGNLANLTIPELQISGLKKTKIIASGKITGLPDMNQAKFDISLRELKSGRVDIKQFLSPGILPENILLPEDFNMSGMFKGGISNFTTMLDFKSSVGNAKLTADLKNGNQKGKEAFTANMDLVHFNAGALLKQDSILGQISGHVFVKGLGLDPKTMNAQFNVVASSAMIKGYDYKNIVFDGNITNQNLALTAKLNDQNIRFDLNAKANIGNKYPVVNLTLNIDTLNLQKLHLNDSALSFHGKMVANLPSTNPDSLIGTLKTSNIIVTKNGVRYPLDSLNLIASYENGKKKLLFKSDIMNASLIGQYKLSEIGSALTIEINKYFKMSNEPEKPLSQPQKFDFVLNATNHPIVQAFVPLLTQLEPVQLKGSFDSENGGLKIQGNIQKIIYSGISLDNLNLIIDSNEKTLNYQLNLDRMATASMIINKTSLNGKLQENNLSVNLNIKDKNEKNKYLFAGLMSEVDDQYKFHFNQDSLMLNYEPWNVSPENFVQFGQKGFMVSNLKLTSSGQTLSVNSNPQQAYAPLLVDFKDFKISTLTALAESDTLIADGVINGNVTLSNLNSVPAFVSDLIIKDFSFKKDTLGDINLKVNNLKANTYAANIVISGKGNDVILSGEYLLKPLNKSSLDFDLDIRKLNLASVEGFSMGNIKDASGSTSGKLKINGTIDEPSIRGDLHFNQAAFNIAMLNAYYTFADEKVSFTPEGIHFDTFTIVDKKGKKAVINGNIYTSNYLDYRFGLDVSSKNFKVLSNTQKDSKLFYGDVILDSDLHIRGNMVNPVVDGSLHVKKGTNLTVVIPQSAPGVVERAGVVEFVDMNDPLNVTDINAVMDSLNTSAINGMDISVAISTDSSAIFNIIIDESSGDMLKVQGDAQLTAGIDPSGKVNLTGTLEITSGAYELSFNFIKRRFEMQNGSMITWKGEPTTADVNLTAVYEANIAPYDLVESKLDETSANLNRYKQKLPFEVKLNMQGELMKPLLTFDITLPKRNYNVASDVVENVQYQLVQLKTQPSELNKQVFSILLLNRFVAENPFASSAGSIGVESLARSSVSKLLSDQMNQLAGNLIEGVDLNFDLISSDDYTTGELQNRTDLNVGISKQLINDRLKVSVGSNFELEGARNTNQKASNIAGNLALDYQLSRDGRYMLRAYRKNEYQGVAEGYLVETGVGFVFTLEYTKFKEIISRNQKSKRANQPDKKKN